MADKRDEWRLPIHYADATWGQGRYCSIARDSWRADGVPYSFLLIGFQNTNRRQNQNDITDLSAIFPHARSGFKSISAFLFVKQKT
ncbi:MAG: hypothetical protein NTX50_22000 [Candidatus Sumerlaeota bacterium]|nr:hypothetical protein [Candidatus Sumerlaeota bacterium]